MESIEPTIFSSVKLLNSSSRFAVYEVCNYYPPTMGSDGIWAAGADAALPSKSSMTIFQLQVVTIFAITQICHFFLKRLGLPLLVSQMMAGIILGPSLEFEALDKYKKMLFPYGSQDTLAVISMLGYNFNLFLCAVQMDFTMITRTGRKSWAIGFSSLIAPILVAFILIFKFNSKLKEWNLGINVNELQVVTISHSSVAFPVIASFLNDLKILNSEIGRLALSTALVSNILSYTIQGIGTAVISGLAHGKTAINLVSLFAYLVLTPLIGRPAMLWVVKHTPEGRPVRKIYTYAIIVMVLVLGIIAMKVNQPFTAGAVVLGLAVPEGPPLGAALVNQLNLFATHFFLPVFVTASVMKVDLSQHYNPNLLMVISSLVFLVYFIKMVLCMGISCYCKMSINDAFILFLILSYKGFVEVCMYTLLYDSLLLSDEVTSMMIFSVLIIACVAQICVKGMYDPARKYAGFQKRNIISLKPNSEFRIVACIHKPSDVSSMKKVLELCSPSKIHPIAVDVLHLMELVGRASPVFISHRLQKRVGSGRYNYSGDVVVAFNLYEHDSQGCASIDTFTVISPMNLMHEDICYIALDKLASLILLPFHIRWSDDGSVESADNNIRALNCRVMERAPCSVGILVNRGFPSSDTASSRVAMIFLGGEDDREALCFARYASREPNASLDVYYLVAKDNDVDLSDWNSILDIEALRDVKQGFGGLQNVRYEEIPVEDATQTTTFLSGMANEYDCIVVGRRHGIKSTQTAALADWIEFPELGVIGDFLASPDLATKASILVLQQQQTL